MGHSFKVRHLIALGALIAKCAQDVVKSVEQVNPADRADPVKAGAAIVQALYEQAAEPLTDLLADMSGMTPAEFREASANAILDILEDPEISRFFARSVGLARGPYGLRSMRSRPDTAGRTKR